MATIGDDDGNVDDAQLDLDEIEKDSTEAADFELETIQSLISGKGDQQRKSSLIAKLEADPCHDFFVTNYSRYREDRWVFEKVANSSVQRILFNCDLLGGNDLKKVLVYHLHPQFHPFGRIRSFVSTVTYSYAFHYLEEHLLRPNGIDATPECIRIISARLINEAFDRSRDKGSPRQYSLLYFILTFWAALSEQGLIPIGHRISVPLRLIDTKERREDVWNAIAAGHKGWSPFTEQELSKLIDYAFFWAERAMPTLLAIRDFLDERGIGKQRHHQVIRSHRFLELEALLSQDVDGITVCGFSMRADTQRIKSSSGKILEYPYYRYWWERKFCDALDRVRDGILILVALVTGMRNGELGVLTFGDVSQRDDGEWHIKVTRFKTSNDPNYFGDTEIIPLPSFIGEMVRNFRKLREFKTFMRKGLLFEQVANPRESRILSRTTQRALSKLSDAVGVDGIHPHRFRKTIAEILINRSERNIDLIRMLFGHKSYRMTLRYIARNPYLIHSVAETMEIHYAEAFVEIVAAVRNGAYSGAAAERIANSAATRPELFKGKLLRLAVYRYIAYLLEAGEPVFIQRTGVGTYCVSSDAYSENNPPPCMGKIKAIEGAIVPDPSNCWLDCRNAIVLEGAREALESNIAFYSTVLDQASASLTKAAQKYLAAKIGINEQHLATLQMKNGGALDGAKTIS